MKYTPYVYARMCFPFFFATLLSCVFMWIFLWWPLREVVVSLSSFYVDLSSRACNKEECAHRRQKAYTKPTDIALRTTISYLVSGFYVFHGATLVNQQKMSPKELRKNTLCCWLCVMQHIKKSGRKGELKVIKT